MLLLEYIKANVAVHLLNLSKSGFICTLVYLGNVTKLVIAIFSRVGQHVMFAIFVMIRGF